MRRVRKKEIELGGSVARALEGAWRSSPVQLDISPSLLDDIAPIILSSGCGPLVWRRIRGLELSSSPAALELQQAYRLSVLHAAVYERAISEVIARLAEVGVQPVLVKGWLAARNYPEPGLRPYGDFDLCVRPEDDATARQVLAAAGSIKYPVDLHRGFTGLDDQEADRILSRSRLVKLGDVELRVPCPEDHLRMLCLHMLKHGVWRPLWLCDVGAAVETRGPEFDWRVCFTASRRVADWVACAIVLAGRMLGARIDDTPAPDRLSDLPRWVTSTVARQWSIPYKIRLPMSTFARRPLKALAELRHHWPNGVEATVNLRAPLNGLPRLPFQIGDCLLRAASYLTTRPGSHRH